MESLTSSKRPYLIKAMIDWINDNDFTPYILVDASLKEVEVPENFIKDNQITLNISPTAANNLNVNLKSISFDGRFNGSATQIFVPSEAILSIYAKETGEGMVFTNDNHKKTKQDKITKKTPHLKLVE